MGSEESRPPLDPETTSLVVSGRGLSRFPFIASPRNKLENLDISKNSLAKFPKHLTKLKVLNMSYNFSGEIPKDVFTRFEFLNSLTELNLSGNSLTKLPSNFQCLSSLKTLNLTANQLTTFSFVIPNLVSLDISRNKLESVPKQIETLLTINAGFNYIKILDISSKTVRQLLIMGNDIRNIEENVIFPKLKQLDISFNQLESLPHISTFAPNLEQIDFSQNQIKEFPKRLPKSILSINAEFNQISTIDYQISKYRTLNTLFLNNNNLKSLPELPTSLISLKICNNHCCHSEPLNLILMKTVDIAENDFEEIPDFSKMAGTALVAFHNKIKKITLEHLSNNLVYCDLHANNIIELPDRLFSNKQLKVLKLCENGISAIPESIVDSQIEQFYINENPIEELPKFPSTLCLFSAAHCKLKVVPSHFSDLPELRMCCLPIRN